MILRTAVSATLVRSGWRWAAIVLSVAMAVVRPDLPVLPPVLLSLYFIFSTSVLVTFRLALPPLGLALLDIIVLGMATWVGGGERSPINIIYLTTMLDVGSHAVVWQAGCLAGIAAVSYALAVWAASAAAGAPFEPTLVMSRGFLFLAAALTSSSLSQAARLAQARAAEADALNSMMRLVVAAPMDLPTMLKAIAHQTCKSLHADCGVAFLTAGSYKEKIGVCDLTKSEMESVQQDIETDELCRQALAGQRVVSSSVAIGRPGLLTASVCPAARFAACAPLVLEGETLGGLWVGRRSGTVFGAAELNLLALLAQQAALAVHNARLHELEKRTVAQLQAAEQAKTEFLSTVSHELRTPLTVIRASAGLLLDSAQGALSPTQVRLLHGIVRNTDRLSNMVAELLDMARLQSGHLPLTCELIDIRPIVQSCVAAMRPLMEQKQQTVAVQLPPNMPRLMADRRRVEQILTNLLSNAHQYAPAGGHLSVVVTVEGNGIVVCVADNGPGVPVEERDLIFQRFYRGASARRGEPSGTGLGLAIAKSLVELHGGTIGYREAKGGGSEFYFRLPLTGPKEDEA